MKHARLYASICLAAVLGTVSCSDLSELENRVDSLESRVEAMETVVKTLNSNVEALKALMDAGTIYSVKESGGVYTLVMSNGQEITLTQGSIGVASAPVMSVDKDGYWMVDYGKGAEYILVGGNKVSAKGSDGVTPQFAVNDKGNWTVSYDGGTTFSEVLGADGKAVSAVSGGASTEDVYFSAIEYDEASQIFNLTLKNGTKLSVPVTTNFLCAIAAEGTQSFNYGEQRNFSVEMKGISSTVVTAPDGWSAVLSESILSVTAPVLTKATLADTRTDVCILALGSNNLAAIAKLKVQLSDSPIAVKPLAAITAGTATMSSISFTVALSDAESWKYLVQAADAVAPSAEKVYETGTAGSASEIVVDGLAEETEYVIYVVPVSGTTLGAVASLSMKTKAEVISDYYAAWEAGKSITIAGVKYSKAADGEATHVTEDITISTNGIYFVEPSATATVEVSGSFQQLMIIGAKNGQRSKVVVKAQIKFNVGNETELKHGLFKNIDFDAASLSNYSIVQNSNTAMGRVAFDDCKITPYAGKPISYISTSTRSFADFQIVNSEYVLSGNNMWTISLSNSTATYANLVFSNNIFYAKSGSVSGFRLYQGPASTIGNIEVTNNTFVNTLSDTSFYINVANSSISSATMTGNLMYFSSNMSSNTGFLRATNFPSTGACKNNAVFKNDDGYAFQPFFGGVDKSLFAAEDVTVLSENPFETFDQANGKFVQRAAYAAYGAQR